MSSLILIPWPLTDWSEAGRIASRTPLPLSENGRDQAQSWAEDLARGGLGMVYSSKERVSIETARIVADRSGAKHKTLPQLAEVDAGLWDGLTTEELERRHTKIFKRWCDDPTSVRPPGGEDVAEAFDRLREPVQLVTRKKADRSVGLVLGPLAFALVRCMIEAEEPARARAMMHNCPLCYDRTEGLEGLEA